MKTRESSGFIGVDERRVGRLEVVRLQAAGPRGAVAAGRDGLVGLREERSLCGA